jgi:rRNA-processing protein FCF1
MESMAHSQTSTLERLRDMARAVEVAFDALLDHCAVNYDDINAGNSGVWFVGWNPYRWVPLEPSAQRHIGEATQALEQFEEMAGLAIRTSAPKRLKSFEKPRRTLQDIATQSDRTSGGVPGSTIDGAREAMRRALREQLAVVEGLPSAHGDGGQILVPDTNAFLFKPALETWNPPPGDWTVVAVPQVIRELDELKTRPSVADRATRVIRRFKEYGRRGDTFKGVKVASRIWLREMPVDADMAAAPSWLRAGHGDDELLASILELQWVDLNATVVVATRDRNLQNKARFARVPYLDVEDDL